MDSHPSRGDSELDIAISTLSLGLRSQSSRTMSYPKRGKKMMLGLLFACVIVFLVCIALTVYLIVVTHSIGKKETDGKTCKEMKAEQKHCSSDTCLEVAAALKQSMNETVDPCEDFFHYSCDGWIKSNPIPPSVNWFSTFGKIAKQNNEKLLLLLLEDDELPNEHAVRKTKNYFKSCMAEEDIENTAIRELRSFITHYGSWPLGNASWSESAWSVTEVLMEFQRDFSAMSPLFVLSMDINPSDSSKYILQVLHMFFN